MKPRDIIKVFWYGYTHWAIVDSIEKKKVWCYHITNLVNNFSTNAQLKREVLEEVAGEYRYTIDNQETKGQMLLKLNHQELPMYNIVRGILKEFEDRTVNYNLFDLNCGHFATFCKYGIGWSTQAEIARLHQAVDPGNMFIFDKSPVLGNLEDWIRNSLIKTLEIFLTGKI